MPQRRSLPIPGLLGQPVDAFHIPSSSFGKRVFVGEHFLFLMESVVKSTTKNTVTNGFNREGGTEINPRALQLF